MHAHHPPRKRCVASPARTKSSAGPHPGSATTGISRGSRLGPAVALRAPVQTKLIVGQRNDSYEREADRVAERVASGQPAGDVSRIPAGGLGAQRRADDGTDERAQTMAQRQSEAADAETQTLAQRQAEADEQAPQSAASPETDTEAAQRQPEKAADEESQAFAQRQENDAEGAGDAAATERPAQKVQRQPGPASGEDQDASSEERAQAKCAACEAAEKNGSEPCAACKAKTVAQRREQDDEPSAADTSGAEQDQAQTKCAACEAEQNTQRKEEDAAGADTAQTASKAADASTAAGGDDSAGATVQRQAAEGSEEEGEEEEEPEPRDAEDTTVTDCAVSEGGEEPEPREGQGEGAQEHLGCGEEGAEEGTEAAAPAGAGGESCGGGEPATEGAPGGAGPETGAAPSHATAGGPVATAPIPACAAGVPAAEEKEGEAEGATEPTPETGAGAGQPASECATQRKEEEGEAEEETPVERQSDDEEAQTARTRPHRREKLDRKTASRLIHTRGGGEPLAMPVKHRLEASLGVDVNGIRVHSDGNAHAAARALNAKAFTHRNHIFLGAGQSQHDLGLMAHEGTHVLQQDAIARRKPAAEAAAALEGAASKPSERGPSPAAGAAIDARTRELPGAATRPAGAQGAADTGTPSAPTAAAPVSPAASPAVTAPPPGATAAGARPTTVAAPTRSAEAPGGPAVAVGGATPATGGVGTPRRAGGTPRGGRPSAAASRGGDGGAPVAPAATPGPALGSEGVESAHPAAAAAAAARLADDRRRRESIGARLAEETVRQKGPAATRGRQKRTSGTAAEAASKAAPSPANEPRSQADEIHIATLATDAKKQPLQKVPFIDAVKAKLQTMNTPSTLEEMDEFKERGGAGQLRSDLGTELDTQVGNSSGKIDRTLNNPPPAPPRREAKDLNPVPGAPRSHALGASDAAPAARAEEEVTLEPNREAVEAELERHRLTRERLEKANDPRFSAVQKAREDVHAHADRAPAAFRREEAASLGTTKRQLAGDEIRAAMRMRGAHGRGQRAARGHQDSAVTREAAERQRIATDIEGIYKRADGDVRAKLEWLAGKDGEPGEVDRRFDRGEKSARDNFEDFVDEEMSDWKWRRYGGRAAIPLVGGLIAGGTWVYDKLAGIDDHPDVIKIFDHGRDVYLSGLKITINAIAEVVESTLTACEQRIAAGKQEVTDYVSKKGLNPSLLKSAKQTAREVFERFDELREDVDAQREELADRLVDRYREAQDSIDQRIKELQAENRGLVRKVVDKVKEVVAAIRNFKNKIGPILAEAGDIIDEVLDDPIGFLGNLLEAIGRGFNQFKAHIDEHLKKGVVSWLFGTLGGAGVNVPRDFSAASIGGLVLEVLGLTPEKLKARAVRLVGPRAVGVAERVTDYLSTLYREGPAGVWEQLKEDVGDLKDRILEEIQSWVITRIVTAAVKKLAMMFNPVGAIIQAILTIYNVIMFFLENLDRILELVRTVVRAAADVVRGKVQTAADKIETAMGMIVPLILAFLARLVGLSGVADKVRSVVNRFRSAVDRAVTKFLRKVVGKFKAAAKKGVAAVKKAGAALLRRFLPKKKFQAGGVTHTLWVRLAGGGKPEPVISSQTQHLSDFLNWLASRKKSEISSDDGEAETIQQATKKGLPKARKLLGDIDALLVTMDAVKGTPNAEDQLAKHSKKLQKLETRLAEVISQMMGASHKNPAPPIPQIKKYQLEGMAATYAALPHATHDQIDKDHQPQAAVISYVASLDLFKDRGIQRYADLAQKTVANQAHGGFAISLHEQRHGLGRTYKSKGKAAYNSAAARIGQIAAQSTPKTKRRDDIVAVMRDEAHDDAKEIRAGVINKPATDKAVFGDIWRLTPKAQGISADPKEAAKQKEKIAESVKKQIEHGVDRVIAQDFDRYKSPL